MAIESKTFWIFLKGIVKQKVSTSWIFSLAPSKFTILTVLCEGAGLANPEMELRPIFQKKHGNGEQNFLDIFEGFCKAKSLYELDF